MIIFLCSLVSIFTGWIAEGDGLLISDQKVICTISRQMTENQLKEFRTQLWLQKKICLDIERLDFGPDKQIRQLIIFVDCNDGFKGRARLTFKDDHTRMRFYRDYDKSAESAFEIGVMPAEK